MHTTWDPEKAKENRTKHGVSFPDAEPVLFDPHAITREDEQAEGEQRFVTVGLDALGRVLVVVYTYWGETIRIISARQATRNERREYERRIRFQARETRRRPPAARQDADHDLH
jgi:uncharacterized protein